MNLTKPIRLLFLALCAVPSMAFGQWTSDSTANTAVVTGSYTQVDPVAVADGSGGAIVAWRDYNPATGYDVYAQRMDTLGYRVWPPGGVAITTTTGDALDLRAAPDGKGGALIAWREVRSFSGSDIFAQRIDSNGTVLWTAGGITVCSADSTQDEPQIVSDGAGGAVVAWRDLRNTTDRNIFAQRIDSNGTVLWTAGGVPVCTTGQDQNDPQIAGDGGGGAVIAWEDIRSGTNFDIYAQRIDATGTAAWITDGIGVSVQPFDQINPRMTADQAGRTIIAWEDARSGTSWDIYAQRVNTSGGLMWNPAAEAVCTATLNQGKITIADDGSGGAFLGWQDDRNVFSTDIYAQHLTSIGGITWAGNGAVVCTANNHQFSPRVLPDRTGGAYFAWHDLRNGADYDIYAQRINASGSAVFQADGIGISISPGSQLDPVIVPDAATGAILAWKDGRNGSQNDIYAQNLLEDGELGILPWVEATAGPHGSIAPAGITGVSRGGSLSFTMTAETGYHVDSVFVNDSYIGSPASYMITDINTVATIRVVFAINIYHLTAAAGPHGTISQEGVTAVVHGQTQAYSITPDPGYIVGLLQVDGAETDTTSYYIFTNITSDHSISAWFTNDSTSLSFVAPRWNLVSVPMVVDDYAKSALFPAASTDAYYFDGSYQPAAVMQNGPGYWLKFDSAGVIAFYGTPLPADTFDVAEGWNMIGSISSDVPVNTIESVPPGIVTSQFFGYASNYSVASSIRPAHGYWVKVQQDGKLVLSASPSAAASSRIRIVSTDEKPPAPPDPGPASDLSSTPSPVPADYALDPNYPNPFNPSTVITFRLPVSSGVTLEIFNIAGERVALLVDGYRQAGAYTITWDASGNPGGVYFCRLRAGTFASTGKMIHLK